MTAQRGDGTRAAALFAEPARVPTPVHRPDGRLYRPRKLPTAMLLGDQDECVVGVCVMRTHSVETARALALEALRQYDSAEPWTVTLDHLAWGRWRPDGPEGERAWERDETGRTGQAAVFFDVDQA